HLRPSGTRRQCSDASRVSTPPSLANSRLATVRQRPSLSTITSGTSTSRSGAAADLPVPARQMVGPTDRVVPNDADVTVPTPVPLEVRVTHDVSCVARDGTALRTDIYEPCEGGPWPVLLMRTPYGKLHAQANTGYSHPAWYAAHGYVVAIQDCRGRWASD